MASLPSGHKVNEVEGEEYERIHEKFPTMDRFIRLSPGGWFFPRNFKNFAAKCYNFEVRPSDVYIMTYPKVGTTWTQEIVWTMKYSPNLDHPDRDLSISDRAPFMDADMLFPEKLDPALVSRMEVLQKTFRKYCPDADLNDGMHIQLAEAIPNPRVIKSHLPLSLMPPDLLNTTKVIYIIRDPKDVLYSFYHHSRLFKMVAFTGTLDEYGEFFTSDSVIYAPYWLHVKEAWEKRHHPNMHIMFYENMKKDFMAELKKLNEFLETKLTDEQLENVKRYTSFEEMQKRDNLVNKDSEFITESIDQQVLKNEGGFFRKGQVGDAKQRFSPELQLKMDEWIKKRFNFGVNY